MGQQQVGTSNNVSLGAVIVLFGLLLLVGQLNEILKQLVIVPGSAAEMNIEANCRADELIEEGLSLRECQLLVSQVEITLESSPSWFRQFQLSLAAITSLAALASIRVGFGLVNQTQLGRLPIFSLSSLVVLDLLAFAAAVNTGPLLRAQYLWPLILWFCIHLCALIATTNHLHPIEVRDS